MTRLILTTSDSGAGSFKQAGLADIVIPFGVRFVWGPLPSDAELAASLAPRATHPDQPIDPGLWNGKHFGEIGGAETGLIDLCERCETIELWIDPDPNSQLTLIWLLDYFRHHREISSRLTLVQADAPIAEQDPEAISRWRPTAVKILNDHLEAASLAWQAHRQPTPQDWFNLLSKDLSVLPLLRQGVVDLLEELPMAASGLGATEMRMLELISAGNAGPYDVFPGDSKRNQRRVFGYWEVGSLLDGLAHGPAPAMAGLAEGPFTEEMHDDRRRHQRYKESRLSLTALGEAILAGTEDFTRHNPIHRWWGGTELTNDRLWRWDPANRALIAP
ncbi:MAG: hypothetical protein QOF07_175 [Bradyrhizobium sp.]|jgi:hypothetical protein|nr:hypothetical protein [Bradyrhizobium sp.]